MRVLSILLCIVVIIASCKKKKNTDPEDETPPPPSVLPLFAMKLNGINMSSCDYCWSSYLSGGLRGLTFELGTGDQQVQFRFSGTPSTGVYSLVKQGNPAMTYIKNFVYYHAVAGSLTITAVDTSAGGSINKFGAKFQCVTDSLAGPIYTITEGSANLNIK